MTEYKACSRCKQILPYEAFDLDKRLKSGRKAQCKNCRVISNSESYARHQEKRKTEARDKYAANPTPHLLAVHKYQSKDRLLTNQRSSDWRNRNPEKVRQYRRERRARLANNKSFYVSEKEFAKMYSSPCFKCGKKGEIEIEHLIPVTRGGDNSIGNYVALCISCNRSKHNKTWMEWRVWKSKQEESPQSPTHD